MSDDTDKRQTDDEAAEESKGPRGGERLAEARREQQISVVEIAKELHLDEPKVRALERNEFDVLGAAVFAKGHLKTYAQLVDVDPSDVMADYYQLTREETALPVLTTRPKPRRELTPGPWIAVIVVIILVVSAFWWFTRPSSSVPEPGLVETPDSDSGMVVTPPATDEEMTRTPPTTDEVMAAEPTTAEEGVVLDDQREAAPEVEEGTLRLLVTYTGDCWTEITDASGRRLLFSLGKDGRTVELSGAEPFNVLFGNPGNVSLRVNGQDYALPPTNRPDRPMRLTISGT